MTLGTPAVIDSTMNLQVKYTAKLNGQFLLKLQFPKSIKLANILPGTKSKTDTVSVQKDSSYTMNYTMKWSAFGSSFIEFSARAFPAAPDSCNPSASKSIEIENKSASEFIVIDDHTRRIDSIQIMPQSVGSGPCSVDISGKVLYTDGNQNGLQRGVYGVKVYCFFKESSGGTLFIPTELFVSTTVDIDGNFSFFFPSKPLDLSGFSSVVLLVTNNNRAASIESGSSLILNVGSSSTPIEVFGFGKGIEVPLTGNKNNIQISNLEIDCDEHNSALLRNMQLSWDFLKALTGDELDNIDVKIEDLIPSAAGGFNYANPFDDKYIGVDPTETSSQVICHEFGHWANNSWWGFWSYSG